MSSRPIAELTAHDLIGLYDGGQLRPSEFVESLSQFVDAADEKVRAFVHRDRQVLDLQAEHLDKQRTTGELPGRLYGVPIAVKDIIDTQDYRTEYGSTIHAGRYAVADATVVARLRASGALIVGKTVTTEFATMVPGPTCNPHNLEHTPGGSSSGSAAAVAAGMVPVALGSQTNGSLIRPASYCGVYGFKPSMGLLPRSGVLEQSPSLDQLGVFARNIEDIALVTEIMSGDDGSDPASKGQFPKRLLDVAMSEPPLDPKFCFVKTPWWDQVEPEAKEAYEALVEHLDGCVEVVGLPEIVTRAVDWHKTVNEVELAFCLQREWNHSRDKLSDDLKTRIEAGMAVSAKDYLVAKDRMLHVTNAFDEYFDKFDAILCPAALGAAPKGLASTGNPIMQTVWSFAGLPSLNLPLMNLSNGLPLGLQAIGKFNNDGRLLRSSRWLVKEFLRRNES